LGENWDQQNFFFCERPSKCLFLYQSATVCGLWMGGMGVDWAKTGTNKTFFFVKGLQSAPSYAKVPRCGVGQGLLWG
jgi:hypothetical protein